MERRIDDEQAIEIIRQYVYAYGTQRAFAQECKVSEQYLGDVLKGKRNIPDSVLKAVGLRRVSYFEKVAN